jgi:hypothetical protein
MRIKKRSHNEYLLSEPEVWVRNFCEPNRPQEDINHLYLPTEYGMLFDNEKNNLKIKRGELEVNRIKYPNVIIASDGYDFKNLQYELAKIPYKEVKIIAVNGALAKWKMVGDEAKLKRAISHYVVNNPYIECSQFVPQHGYCPNCIASIRTHPKFTKSYKGRIHFYQPATSTHYSGAMQDLRPIIDDYRNPICAALFLAFAFEAKKILLFGCDSSFKEKRSASVQLENGLYTYPQQIASQQIIDACLYWLKKKGVQICNHSNGINYRHAEYIETEKILDFFHKDDDE